MLKKVLLGVAVVLIVMVALVVRRPDHYHVERTLSMAAPASVVLAQIDDFHAWQAWSPWAKLDPTMKTSFEGPARGVGASYSWQGNDKVGKGKMTILEASPKQVKLRLEFLEPFESTALTTFSLSEDAQGSTSTTWAMEGENNFMGKLFGMFMDMDQMIGADFEKGLAAMKQVAEAEAKRQAAERAAVQPAPGPAAPSAP